MPNLVQRKDEKTGTSLGAPNPQPNPPASSYRQGTPTTLPSGPVGRPGSPASPAMQFLRAVASRGTTPNSDRGNLTVKPREVPGTGGIRPPIPPPGATDVPPRTGPRYLGPPVKEGSGLGDPTILPPQGPRTRQIPPRMVPPPGWEGGPTTEFKPKQGTGGIRPADGGGLPNLRQGVAATFNPGTKPVVGTPVKKFGAVPSWVTEAGIPMPDAGDDPNVKLFNPWEGKWAEDGPSLNGSEGWAGQGAGRPGPEVVPKPRPGVEYTDEDGRFGDPFGVRLPPGQR